MNIKPIFNHKHSFNCRYLQDLQERTQNSLYNPYLSIKWQQCFWLRFRWLRFRSTNGFALVAGFCSGWAESKANCHKITYCPWTCLNCFVHTPHLCQQNSTKDITIILIMGTQKTRLVAKERSIKNFLCLM